MDAAQERVGPRTGYPTIWGALLSPLFSRHRSGDFATIFFQNFSNFFWPWQNTDLFSRGAHGGKLCSWLQCPGHSRKNSHRQRASLKSTGTASISATSAARGRWPRGTPDRCSCRWPRQWRPSPAKGPSIKLGSLLLSLVNTGSNGKHISVLCSFFLYQRSTPSSFSAVCNCFS